MVRSSIVLQLAVFVGNVLSEIAQKFVDGPILRRIRGGREALQAFWKQVGLHP